MIKKKERSTAPISKAQNVTDFPKDSKRSRKKEIRIKNKETRTGANTGDVQGTGIKNKISQVIKEGGQLRNTLSQI
ncbi:MAG: hypothetical protein KAS39_07240 [Actinomycetia bacterium]|nr:hypothetical protein [Actinomycetes bacterium]